MTAQTSTAGTTTTGPPGAAADGARRRLPTRTPLTWTPSPTRSILATGTPLATPPVATPACAPLTSPSGRRERAPSATCRDPPAQRPHGVRSGVRSGVTSGVTSAVTSGPPGARPMRRQVHRACNVPACLRDRLARHRATRWPQPAAHGSGPRICLQVTAGRGHRVAPGPALRGRVPDRPPRHGSALGSLPFSRRTAPWNTRASRRTPRLLGRARPGPSRADTGPANRPGRVSPVLGRTRRARARAGRAGQGSRDLDSSPPAGRTGHPHGVTSGVISAVMSVPPGARPMAVLPRGTDRAGGTGQARHRRAAGRPRAGSPRRRASAAPVRTSAGPTRDGSHIPRAVTPTRPRRSPGSNSGQASRTAPVAPGLWA
jgi:hypothetical protein